jgi:hypothetical protein
MMPANVWKERRATDIFADACNMGAAKGCALLAEQFQFGIGVPKDVFAARLRAGRSNRMRICGSSRHGASVLGCGP